MWCDPSGSCVSPIEREDALLKVESDIELAQEIQSNNAVDTVLLREGVDKDIEVINFSVGQGKGFESYLRDNMTLGGITKGSRLCNLSKVEATLDCCCLRDDGIGGASIKRQNKYMSALEFNATFKRQNSGIGIEGDFAHKTTAMPFLGFGPV